MIAEKAVIPIEEKRYSFLILSLKTEDNDNAFEEVVDIIGQEDLKPYQENLIEKTLEHVSKGPDDGTSIHLKFTRNLVDKLSSHRGDGINPDKIIEALDKIISYPQANRHARKFALDEIFAFPQGRVTMDTVNSIQEAFNSPKALHKGSFEYVAIVSASEISMRFIGSNLEDEAPLKALQTLIIDKLLEGNLLEGNARVFTKELISELPDTVEQVEKVSECTNLAEDIPLLAKRAMERLW